MKEIKLKKTIVYLIPCIISLIAWFSHIIYYHGSDDPWMNYLNWGKFTGNTNEHLVFINSSFGFLNKIFYKWIPNYNWFAVFYLIIILICVYALMTLFIKRERIWTGLIVGLFVEVFLLYYFSFTTTAFCCTAIGIIKCLDNAYSKNSRLEFILNTILAIFLLSMGYVLRNNSFKVAVAISLPLIMLTTIKRKNYKEVLLVVFLTIISVSSLWLINNIDYQDTQWQSYLNFNSLRSQAVDFPIAEYQSDQKLYKSIKYSQNDYECLTNWSFGDKKVFSEKNLKKIVDGTPSRVRYNLDFLAIIKGMIRSPIFLVFIIWTILLVISGKKKFYLLQGGFCTLIFILLIIINRAPERVVVPLFLIGMINMIYYYLSNEGKNSYGRLMNYAVVATIIMGVGYYCLDDYHFIGNKRISHNNNRQVIEYTQKNKDKAFITNYVDSLLYNEDVSSISNNEHYSNILNTGNQDIYSKYYYMQVQQNNLKYKDRLLINLLDSKRVYLIIDENNYPESLSRITNYLNEHTNKKVKPKVIKSFKHNLKIYNFEQ